MKHKASLLVFRYHAFQLAVGHRAITPVLFSRTQQPRWLLVLFSVQLLVLSLLVLSPPALSPLVR